MQRLLRIHCRGAPSSRIRPEQTLFSLAKHLIPLRRVVQPRFLHNSVFTCQKASFSPRLLSRHFPRHRVILAISAAAAVPAVIHVSENDKQEDDSTLEQLLLDTSEDERTAHLYGVNAEHSIFYRFFRHMKIAFMRYIYEPIAIGLRFIQLVVIFVPVFATIPFIFIGLRDPQHDNERTGTLWWYAFLVKQMERAGPTFIKVILFCRPLLM
jgi:hypothetical protein